MNNSLADLVCFLTGIGFGGLFVYVLLSKNTYNVNVNLGGEAVLVRKTYVHDNDVVEEDYEEQEDEEQEEYEEQEDEEVEDDSIEVDENLNVDTTEQTNNEDYHSDDAKEE